MWSFIQAHRSAGGFVPRTHVKIPFLDLRRQYRSIAEEVDRAIREVLENVQFILGPQVKAFEDDMARYCGATHSIGVASGTDALRLALETVGVGPGCEVIVPPFTFVATAEMVSQLGATPIFADIDAGTYTIDPDQVARRITPKTKAIVPVHLYGHPADMKPIMELADRHGLWVIEDAAQAIGAEHGNRRVGAIGHLGCFSFFPTKNLGGYGDGGLVMTDSVEIANRIRMLRQHGSREKYRYESLGWSSRLDELQAAVLRVKLRHLDEWTECRRANVQLYRKLLAPLPVQLPLERVGDRAVYHLFTIRTPHRDELKKYLSDRGIETMVYYPIPLHLQPVYENLEMGSLPESERASREVLSLPLFPELQPDELEIVASTIAEFFLGGDTKEW